MVRLALKLKVIGVLFFFSTFSFAAAPKEVLWTYQYGLVTFNERHSVSILNMMYEYALDLDIQRTDVIAELLLTRFNDEQYDEKLIIWYGRVLGASKQNRYADLLTDIGSKSASERVQKEFRAHAKGLNHKKIKKADQYVKGTIDLSALREQYITAAQRFDNADKAEILADLAKQSKKKVRLKDMFDKMGEPQHLRVGGMYNLMGLHFYFYYNDLGRVDFEFDTRKEVFSLEDIDQNSLAYQLDTPIYSLTNRAIDEDLAVNMLVSTNYNANLNIFIHYVDLGYVPSHQFNDISAEILSRYLETGDKVHEVRIYNWICRSLGLHGNGRYQALLEKAAEVDGQSRLIKAAERGLEETNQKADVEPYVPGTVDLNSVVKKYSQNE